MSYIKEILREILSGILQGIGFVIGMAVCGVAYVVFHILIWPLLIIAFPVTIFVLWRNPNFVRQLWETIRSWIWKEIYKSYGYRHTPMLAIEPPKSEPETGATGVGGAIDATGAVFESGTNIVPYESNMVHARGFNPFSRHTQNQVDKGIT
jgi:hypothetical protein